MLAGVSLTERSKPRKKHVLDTHILKAIEDGPTYEELSERIGLSLRQTKRRVRSLMLQGKVYDAMQNQRGMALKHRIHLRDEGETVPAPPKQHIGNSVEALEESIYESAQRAVSAIRASSRCKDRERVRAICNEFVRPAIEYVEEYRGMRVHHLYMGGDFRVPTIAEFLTEPEPEYLSFMKRHRMKSKRNGTIRARHPASHHRADSFYPTLEEWDQYLSYLVENLGAKCTRRRIFKYLREEEDADLVKMEGPRNDQG